MDSQIKNKKILLVGCTGTIGSAFTEFLYKNGGSLILADLEVKNLLILKENILKLFL